jgi:acyl-coenzyme A thioesterase PaaI-like protein
MITSPHIFIGLTCFSAPYTGTISSFVKELTTESCSTEIYDRPWLRNPFGSLHAIALSNLGELTSGLLMVTVLQHNSFARGIPVKIETVFHAKARGTITAKCNIVSKGLIDAARLEQTDKYDVTVSVLMYDSKKVLVAETNVIWSIGKNARKAKKSD